MSPFVYPARLVRVVDGDTIDVELDLGFDIRLNERVRLAGVDAPEVFGARATPGGRLAKAWAQAWLDEAKTLTLHSLKYNAREKYGRVLGELYRALDAGPDPVSLSAALRAAKMAG